MVHVMCTEMEETCVLIQEACKKLDKSQNGDFKDIGKRVNEDLLQFDAKYPGFFSN